MASEYTDNLHLDLYTDNDKPNLRDQYNAAMRKIDTAVTTQNTLIAAATSTAQGADAKADAVDAKADSIAADLDTETTQRQAEDADLAIAINSEASTRAAKDTSLENDILDLSSKFDDLKNKTEIICFGDSFGNAPQSAPCWPQQLSSILDLNLHTYCHGGYGYAREGYLISSEVDEALDDFDTAEKRAKVKYIYLLQVLTTPIMVL